jgi:endoglucanase
MKIKVKFKHHFVHFIFFFLLGYSVLVKGSIGGLRGIQIRSDMVVTAWLGYLATTDTAKLKDISFYRITSPDDDDYKDFAHPVKISRFSKGSRSAGGPFDKRALCDQFMHLYLENPFKVGKRYILHLSEGLIPKNMQRTMQFRFDATPNPGFKLNQVGYSNSVKTKHVYLSSYLGDGKPVDLSIAKTFFVINANSYEIAFKGPIVHVSDCDPQGHDELYRIDISDFNKEGEFYIWVDKVGRSYNFKNGEAAVNEIYDIISRGMYFQRRSTEIVPPYAGKWARPMAHNRVYVTKKNIVHPWMIRNITHPWTIEDIMLDPSDPAAGDYYVHEGPREIRGGHYDAGDFDTRLTHFVVSEKLMNLFEALPNNFFDGQVLIPENSNGIPDILDEVAWSLLHLEMLQDYFGEFRGSFGAVPPGVESWTHPPQFAGTGDFDILPYYMRKATPYSTFCGAAVFAQAARVFEKVDPAHAAKFLERARAAYQYAVAHKNEKWNPENLKVLPLDWEEVYDDSILNTAWCWAAAQMFSTTGGKEYWQDFEKRCNNIVPFFKQDPWKTIYPVIVTRQKLPDTNVVKRLRERLLEKATEQVGWIIDNGQKGYQASVPNKGSWGFGNPIAQQEILWLAYYITREQKYLDAIAVNVDFTLGMNPSEISWMTGAGTVYPMDPLSINGKFDGVEEPIPGSVICGPTENWDHPMNPLYPNPESMGFYRRISDVWNFVEGCEYVVDEQQTNMYVSAGILLNSGKSDKDE